MKSIVGIGFARALTLAFTLVAFVLQSYITQTHIHASQGSAIGVDDVSASVKAGHGKTPLDKDDPAHCPFCHEMLRAGSFVIPAAILVPLPEQNASFIPIAIAVTRHVDAAAHHWHGRAPPTA